MKEIVLKPGKNMGRPASRGEMLLPDELINDMGGNSQVYPDKLKKHNENITGLQEDEWFEYLPDAYDGKKNLPLVISCHGGRGPGWRQCVSTSWSMVAEREGFIVVFPSHPFNQEWLIVEEGVPVKGKDDYGLKFLSTLISVLLDRYTIDKEKIYMQGMSAGDVTTMQFARYYGNLLAGAAQAAGPSISEVLFSETGEPVDYVCPVPVYQFQGELDSFSADKKCSRWEVNAYNREFWMKINQCQQVPLLQIDGPDNFAFFKGEKGDVMFRSMADRAHGQPFDDAEYVWRYFFSGYRRTGNGDIVREGFLEPFEGDPQAIIFAEGCGHCYQNNELIKLAAVPAVYDLIDIKYQSQNDMTGVYKYMYISTDDLCRCFFMTQEKQLSGRMVLLKTRDGINIRIADGNIACIVDNRVYAMSRAAEFDGNALYVPVRWFAERLFGYCVTEYEGALYISDHAANMTEDMAVLIKKVLE